jgi:hypothetical protein
MSAGIRVGLVLAIAVLVAPAHVNSAAPLSATYYSEPLAGFAAHFHCSVLNVGSAPVTVRAVAICAEGAGCRTSTSCASATLDPGEGCSASDEGFEIMEDQQSWCRVRAESFRTILLRGAFQADDNATELR